MSSLENTKTQANLAAAFAGESQALCKYTYYASQAKKDGYEQIAAVFAETAHNEREHAKIWFKLLRDGMPGTTENLSDAAAGEHGEWTEMYAAFAEQAREEGFDQIADLFEGVAAIEKQHEARFGKLLEEVSAQQVFEKPQPVCWVCRNCGHVHSGEQAPLQCPICAHPQAYFEPRG